MLYGEVDNEGLSVTSEGPSLLQSNLDTKSQQDSYLGISGISGINSASQSTTSTILGLSSDFVSVATESAMDSTSVYLTAKPYQLLYASYLSTQEL